MAIAVTPPGPRVVIRNVSWGTYEALLRERGDEGPRMAYDRGTLEIMSPTFKHENLKKMTGSLVETFSVELDIDIRRSGSTTFKSQLKERGLEPDESYYIQNERLVREKDDIDLEVDPPPDLSIEIDLHRSNLDKLGLYAGLGIPEVWSHDGERLVVHLLQPSGTFAISDRSAAFPQLPIEELNRFLRQIGSRSETQIVRTFREWVRERFGIR
jgi:Uma2 family endonuclease